MTSSDHATWDNPLTARYAGPAMAALWSAQRRVGSWRRLWVALAEAQHELGMTADDGKTPRIPPAQIDQLRPPVGKRATLWLYDLVLDLEETEHRLANQRFRGAKGTTGTQASFLTLFHGDHAKVRQLDELVAKKMGFDAVYPVTGQTYSRKVDSQAVDALAGLGQTAHKVGTDLRLLAHRQEIDEPFEAEQAGSSAMPYKRNPMRCE